MSEVGDTNPDTSTRHNWYICLSVFFYTYIYTWMLVYFAANTTNFPSLKQGDFGEVSTTKQRLVSFSSIKQFKTLAPASTLEVLNPIGRFRFTANLFTM